jgi:Ig-like domain from next to BRCA1 gene
VEEEKMSTRNMKFLFWFAILALVMACAPSLATPFPTANPNQVNQFIALTANAAATQTAAVLPTSSPTATVTPTPRNTETATLTFTSTVIFILSSPTKPVPPTLVIIGGGGSGGGGSSGGGSSSSNYACQVVSVSPSNGSSFKSRDDFDTTWRVKNTGQKNWDRNSVDFVYLSGAKIHKIAGYDLSNSVSTGSTIDLSVDMVAPKDSGTYTTTWTLTVGSKDFCNMSLTIVVS